VINRIFRVFRLDATVFREIAEDKGAMSQAAIVVVVVFFLSAIGSAIGAAIAGSGAILSFFVTLLMGVLISWLLWAVLTYFVGTLLFKGKTDIPEMMRVLGFASAPNILGIFSAIPCVGWIAALAGGILALVAGVIGIREAMEFDTGKAVITVLIAWVISFVITLIIGMIVGVGAAVGTSLTGG
jgi:hypothetical protein